MIIDGVTTHANQPHLRSAARLRWKLRITVSVRTFVKHDSANDTHYMKRSAISVSATCTIDTSLRAHLGKVALRSPIWWYTSYVSRESVGTLGKESYRHADRMRTCSKPS